MGLKIGNVFDESFDSQIFFSLAKPTKFSPVQGQVNSLVGSAYGACKRACEAATCECSDGSDECPGEGIGCFSDIERCRCHDEYYENGEVKYDQGRCDVGTYCLVIDGVECTDPGCCQPAPREQVCLHTYREHKGQNPNGVGSFELDAVCPDVPEIGLLETGVPACRGCVKGSCTFTEMRYYIQPISYCVPDVTKKQCVGISQRWGGGDSPTFKCCRETDPPACRCESECPNPPGPPVCRDVSEYMIQSENAISGFGNECFCACFGNNKVGIITPDGEELQVCVECGENSTWNKTAKKCECEGGYETPSGGNGFSLLTDFGSFTIENGVFGGTQPEDQFKRAHPPGCTIKKYGCKVTDKGINEDGYRDIKSECVYVPPADRNGSEYDGGTSECTILCMKYSCVNGECVPDVNGEHNLQGLCWLAGCERHECVDGNCVSVPGKSRVGAPNVYDNKKRCLDGCQSSGGGNTGGGNTGGCVNCDPLPNRNCCVAGKIWDGTPVTTPTCITCTNSEFKMVGDVCSCVGCDCDTPASVSNPSDYCIDWCFKNGTPISP